MSVGDKPPLEFESLDGQRFLGGEGPILLVRLHESSAMHVRYELHDNGNPSAGGVCPIDVLTPAMRALLLRAD